MSDINITEQYIDAIIDTPKGSRNKYKYDEKRKAFFLKKILPAGAAFPYNFGYIDNTISEDGDPIDIMILMEEPAFTGCIVPCRIIGAVKAIQTKGTSCRNDRLLGVVPASPMFGHYTDISQLPGKLIDEVEHFFISYNQFEGKEFKPIGRAGAQEAAALLEAARKGK